jgi:hypothetical protein
VLGCGPPPLILQEPDPRLRSNAGRFTWDGRYNSIAKPILPELKPAFAWIDSVMACGLGLGLDDDVVQNVRYIDNRSIAMRLPVPVPEIAPFWTSKCTRWRNQHSSHHPSYSALNRHIHRRLLIGHHQLTRLQAMYAHQKQQGNATSWADFVKAAPFAISSQLWKGAAFYGLRTDDLHVLKETSHLKIGDPHPFRMLSDVTDHHAVLSRILL